MLSRKSRLCIKVLVAVASAPPGKPVTAHTLSARLHVSVSHLESIARVLREAGLLRASKGPGGGYYIACDADTTSVWDVVQRVDDQLRQPSDTANGNSLIATVEEGVRSTFVNFLSSRTIGDYADTEALFGPLQARPASRFRLQPLPAAAPPSGPNSVFQLSSHARSAAA